MRTFRALLLVDLQKDFLPGGALAVPGGDETIPVANRLLDAREGLFDLTVATQDWHPEGHVSFASSHAGRSVGEIVNLGGLNQVLWPVHCVQESHGAALAPGLESPRIDRLVRKGTDAAVDSYSAFFDNGRRHATGLGDTLREADIREIWLLGLATDYCVKFTALDARCLGFHVVLLVDGCRAVELHPGDGERALREMREAGVQITTSEAALSRRGGR